MRRLSLIPDIVCLFVLWFDPCAYLKEKYNHLNSLICQYYFCFLHFVGDMLVVHYQIEIQKLLKNCHPFWEAWGISCKYLSKDIELYCFSKETPKNGYIPPNFFKSLLLNIFTQNPALICLTNSLLWKLHSHPSVLPICTNWTDDNIWGSKLCKLTKQILTCKHSYFFLSFSTCCYDKCQWQKNKRKIFSTAAQLSWHTRQYWSEHSRDSNC